MSRSEIAGAYHSAHHQMWPRATRTMQLQSMIRDEFIKGGGTAFSARRLFTAPGSPRDAVRTGGSTEPSLSQRSRAAIEPQRQDE